PNPCPPAVAEEDPLASATAAAASPSNLLLKSSNLSSPLAPLTLLLSFSPTSQAGTLHLAPTPGKISILHANPTNHPTAAGNTVPGNWDSANCAATRYVVDLSENSSVKDLEEEEEEVEMRYRNECGIERWYWDRRAKIVGVGPEG
ncbi:hypothetical protein BBP40_001099, partial [Aspergillus hancockii]